MKKEKLKKVFKVIMIIFIILAVVGFVWYRMFSGPSVKIKDKIEIKKYAEKYLTKKYGEHKYKVTGIKYEYDMAYVFDYSNPTGYWVDFKSDVAKDSWIVIKGLKPDDYKVESDFFINSYINSNYYPKKDGFNIIEMMEDMAPKNEFETTLLNELQNEFEPNAYEVKCNYIRLNIPENYGKIPTLEELKTDTNLYTTGGFDYKVSNTIEDINEYEERLKLYISNKYNCNSSIYFGQKNTLVSIFLEN